MKFQRNWSNQDLINAINESQSFNDVYKKLNIGKGGHRCILQCAKELNINLEHLYKKKIRAFKWKARWTLDEFKNVISNSYSFNEVLTKLKLSGSGRRTVKKYIAIFNLDVSHFKGRQNSGNKTNFRRNKIPLNELLVIANNDLYSTFNLKNRLLKEGLLKNICYECGQSNSWNGKELKLQLDHKNGNRIDNRLENLRILCPNCHSQTDTYAGKNKK